MTAQPDPPYYPGRVYAPMASNAQLLEEKLSVSRVSELLGVSPMTVYRLIHTKVLRHYKVGRSFVIPISAVRQYLGEAASDAWDGES